MVVFHSYVSIPEGTVKLQGSKDRHRTGQPSCLGDRRHFFRCYHWPCWHFRASKPDPNEKPCAKHLRNITKRLQNYKMVFKHYIYIHIYTVYNLTTIYQNYPRLYYLRISTLAPIISESRWQVLQTPPLLWGWCASGGLCAERALLRSLGLALLTAQMSSAKKNARLKAAAWRPL